MENLQHFILSNRQVRYNQQAKTYHYVIDNNIAANLPLRYTAFEFEPRYYTEQSWIPNAVQEWGQSFIEQVVAAAKNLPAHCRNVTLYIHGFHHLANLSYKLDVMKGMVDAYCTNDEQRVVGKFIFFSWPATQTRSTMAARAYEMGLNLFSGKNIKIFEDLFTALEKAGIELNLMAHSFGHHILNGFMAAYAGNKSTRPLFNKVFLFAPDIPHAALSNKNGMTDEKTHRLYNLNLLEKMAGITYCYYCRYDRMLIASTDGEVNRKHDNDKIEITGYLCLGMVGDKYAGDFRRPNIVFVNALPLVRNEERFKRAFDQKHIIKQMDVILDSYTFEKSNQTFFAILSSVRKPWVDLHRYSYLSNTVVANVREQCKKGV